MSFITDFFGSGGVGSSLVGSAGSVATGLVANKGEEIKGYYKTELQKLTNDATLSNEQFQLELAKLNQTRDAALADYNDQKRGDTLMMVGVVGGLLLIATVSVLLILKRKR